MYESIDPVERSSWDVQVINIGRERVGQSYRSIRVGPDSCSIFMLESSASDVIENDILPYSDSLLGSEATRSPWSALRGINARLYRTARDQNTTACLGICTASGLVYIAFAGFPCAYVQQHGELVRRLAGGGAPLGVLADFQYPEKSCLLERGEAALFVNANAEALLRARRISAVELFAAARFQRALLLGAPRQAAAAIVVRRLGPALPFRQQACASAVSDRGESERHRHMMTTGRVR